MAKEFRPLEQIADDVSVAPGDLVQLRRTFLGHDGEPTSFTDWAVLYLGTDTYVSDGSAGFKEGEQFPGVRIATSRRSTGELGGFNTTTVFYDRDKGQLVPFDTDPDKKQADTYRPLVGAAELL